MWTDLQELWQPISQFSVANHLDDAAKIMLLTSLVPLALGAVRRLFGRIALWVKANQPMPSISFRRLELVSSRQVGQLVVGLVKTSYMALQLAVVYLYISILFRLFTPTRQTGDFLLAIVASIALKLWASVVAYLPNLVSMGLIIIVSVYVVKFLKLLLDAIASETMIFEGFHKSWALPTFKIARSLIVMMVLVMVFPLLPGFNSPAFQGIGVFVGLLLSIGSSSAIANIVAGTVLIYTRSFDVGDRIETNGVTGDVVEKTLLATRIRTINQEIVTIPNSAILNTATTNYSELADDGDGIVLHTSITIGYDVDWRRVHELLKEAAGRTHLVDTHQPVVVYQTSLDDFYVAYEVRVITRQPQQMAAIYSELHQHILDVFNAGGVEICSPHYRAHRQDDCAMPEQNPVIATSQETADNIKPSTV